MFTILLIVSMFSQGLTIVSYGKRFITAFPEDLGFFYPNTSSRLRVTTLYDGTSVDIFYNGSSTPTQTISNIQKSQTVTVVFPKSAEVYQFNYSAKSIRINSNKYIVVHSVSNTDFGINAISVQTNVVQPNENLGINYLIPSLNYTTYLTAFGISQSTSWSTRYDSFKLIIINAEDTENNITIVKNISAKIQLVNFTIPSYQLIQVQADASLKMVNSSCKIAVLLTHPCLDKPDCTCSMIVNQILPVRFQGQNFFIPSVRGITLRQLFMTSNDKADLLTENNSQLTPSSSGFLSLPDLGTKYVTASSNVSLRLIIPGLFIELIPENMFAACYILPFYSNNRLAVVIAKTASRNQVTLGIDQQINPPWYEISAQYSIAEITLPSPMNIIWHPISKIGVYILEKIDNTVYGGPATPINEQPDPNGCMAPGEFVVGDKPLKWTESLAYCTTSQSEFACPTDEDLQTEFTKQVNTNNVEGWIGLRRSLMTTEWYWQKSKTSASSSVNYVYWANGQPQAKIMGLCASLSLNRKDDFKWKSARCCEKKLSICYKQPKKIAPLYMPSIEYYPIS